MDDAPDPAVAVAVIVDVPLPTLTVDGTATSDTLGLPFTVSVIVLLTGASATSVTVTVIVYVVPAVPPLTVEVVDEEGGVKVSPDGLAVQVIVLPTGSPPPIPASTNIVSVSQIEAIVVPFGNCGLTSKGLPEEGVTVMVTASVAVHVPFVTVAVYV
jgi:hypothetical protein